MFRFPLTRLAISAAASAVLLASAFVSTTRADEAVVIPAPMSDLPASGGPEIAVLAGGCFWGVQGVFQHTKGVLNAVSGYTGGSKDDANYPASGTGTTGHAESVQVTFDPKVITYGKLLQIYFSVAHDPTELNRQGPDSGTQYRSTIFAQNDAQKQTARSYIAQLNAAKVYGEPIVTTIETGKTFYPAEEYHQDYLTLHPYQPYIVYNDAPKIAALKKIFADYYRDKPALVRDAKAAN